MFYSQATFLFLLKTDLSAHRSESIIVYSPLFCFDRLGIKNFYTSAQILISASESFLLKYSQIQFSEYIF